MSQTVTYDVPCPWTRLRLGYRAVSAGHDGFSVSTDGHVWLTALSSPAGPSTFTAHATESIRVVSTDDTTYLFADEAIKAVTEGDLRIAAGGGAQVVAGFSAKTELQRPKDDIGSPRAAEDVSEGCETVSAAWTAADIAINVLAAVKSAGTSVLAGPANPRVGLDVSTVAAALDVASHIAGAATSAAMLGDKAPGIDIHGTNSVNFYTPAFASFYGLEGLLLASPYSCQIFGGATAVMVGLGSAGMSALGKADVSSKGETRVETGGSLGIRSTVGEVFLKGKTVEIGQALPDPLCPAQVVTAQVGFVGGGVALRSPNGSIQLGRTLLDLAEEMKVAGLLETLDAVTEAKETLGETSELAEGAQALFTGTRNVLSVPTAIRELQPPPKDPVITALNVLGVGGALLVGVAEAIKIVGPGYAVLVEAEGITLAATEPDPLGENTEPAGPSVTLDIEGAALDAMGTFALFGPCGSAMGLGSAKARGGTYIDFTECDIAFKGQTVKFI